MKSQDDRYTVVYESKAFPYFTINVAPPPIMAGNRGGTTAFFERISFYSANLDMFVGLGVYVNADGGFHVRDGVTFELLHSQVCAYLHEKGRDPSGAEHEAL